MAPSGAGTPILGVWDGHDAGAALVDPEKGAILCAVNEERLSRRKLEIGFPQRSIDACLREAALEPEDILDVAVSTFDFAKTLARWFPSMGESYYVLRRRKRRPKALDRYRRAFKYVATTIKPNRLTRALSERALGRKLAEAGFSHSHLSLVKHHLAHAASAAYTSGFEDALVVTLDGVGDGLSGSLSRLREGRLEAVSLLPARHSLGIFYELVTQLLNMRELEDEGKVMALATYGYAPAGGSNPLMDLFEIDGLQVRSRLGVLALRRFLERELAVVPSEQFAFMAQAVLETKVLELVRAAIQKTGARRIAYAGGVASNIQLNLKLRDIAECEELFVFPHMGDGGLALGAALARAAETGSSRACTLGDLRLGPRIPPGEIEDALRGSGLRFHKLSCVAEVSRRLQAEQVVLWFQGRMEYGPRALGGRSILARPDRPAIRDRLNLRLKRRVWYQPFCPSILDEDASRLLEGGDVPNRYMTMAYRVRPEGRAQLAGVLGRDGTCRPQMVDARYGRFHELLESMKETIGVGAVLNTSLNEHGEPLVARPSEALRALVRLGADALVLEDFLVEPDARVAR